MDILIYENMTPIVWVSKYQNTIESSTFVSEFIALKHACEYIHGLRNRLRLIGVLLDWPTRILCDNEDIIKNISFSKSIMYNKYWYIAYHIIHKSIASERNLLYYEISKTNIRGLFTKLVSREVRKKLVYGIMFWHHVVIRMTY